MDNLITRLREFKPQYNHTELENEAADRIEELEWALVEIHNILLTPIPVNHAHRDIEAALAIIDDMIGPILG